MKHKIILCALFLVSCSYGDRSTWDSGGEAENQYQEQRQEEMTDGVNNRLPEVGKPHTEAAQPF